MSHEALGFSVQLRRFGGILRGEKRYVASGSTGITFDTNRIEWNGLQSYRVFGLDLFRYTEKIKLFMSAEGEDRGNVVVENPGSRNAMRHFITKFAPTPEGTKVALGFAKTVFVRARS